MSKHTPEPWTTCKHNADGGLVVDDASREIRGPAGTAIASMAYDGYPCESDPYVDSYVCIKAEDAERIVACVNALAGVEDPQAFVSELSALKEENAQLRRDMNNIANPSHLRNAGERLSCEQYEAMIAMRTDDLLKQEKENDELRSELSALKEENAQLRKALGDTDAESIDSSIAARINEAFRTLGPPSQLDTVRKVERIEKSLTELLFAVQLLHNKTITLKDSP